MDLEWLNAVPVDPVILVTLFIGVVTGALVTGWMAHRHFKQAGGRLDREARTLRELNVMLLESLEMQGIVSVRRDVKGRLVGWRFLTRGSTGSVGDDTSGEKGRVEPKVSLRSTAAQSKQPQVAARR